MNAHRADIAVSAIYITPARAEVVDFTHAYLSGGLVALVKDNNTSINTLANLVREYQKAASTGVVVGLCPTTEGNLGDGIFDYPLWRKHQGRWGMGSDSNATVSVAEELLMLEYSQRFHLRQRNIGASDDHPEVATALYLGAVSGGAQASGCNVDGIASGQCADFVELDVNHHAMALLPVEKALAGHIFGSSRTSVIQRVWTRGQLRVSHNQHLLHERALEDVVKVRQQLFA